MSKYVMIDNKKYEFKDPYDCCFNYDGVGCAFPGSMLLECLGWKEFPENCPLKENDD